MIVNCLSKNSDVKVLSMDAHLIINQTFRCKFFKTCIKMNCGRSVGGCGCFICARSFGP